MSKLEINDKLHTINTLAEHLEQAFDNIIDSREKSLALTKLEECMMWVNKAIKEDQLYKEANKSSFEVLEMLEEGKQNDHKQTKYA